MSQSLGYAAVKKEGVGIALFTDLGDYAFSAAHPLYASVVSAVEDEQPLTQFDYLLTETVLETPAS